MVIQKITHVPSYMQFPNEKGSFDKFSCLCGPQGSGGLGPLVLLQANVCKSMRKVEASGKDGSLSVMMGIPRTLMMGRGAIVESDGGGLCVCLQAAMSQFLALGATEEPEVCFYQTVGLGGVFFE